MTSEEWGYLFGLAIFICVCAMAVVIGLGSALHLPFWLIFPVSSGAFALHLYISKVADVIASRLKP